jgi:dTMP kinase
VARGRLITFEGIEGSGKSSQARALLTRLGARAVLSREPGGTPLGARIRAIVLDSDDVSVSPFAEALLFLADRKQHLDDVIRPALAKGVDVIVDRYIDSSLAYQGVGRGVDQGFLRSAFAAIGGIWPDLTVLLDLDVRVALDRLRSRGDRNRLDRESQRFHETVRAAFLELAKAEARRFVVIDAASEPSEVAARVHAAVDLVPAPDPSARVETPPRS